VPSTRDLGALAHPLLHLVGARDWELDGDAYVPASLVTEGFVHLSAAHQVRRVAEGRFAGREDLLLLVVDPDRLGAPVVWEDTVGEGEDFPHVYAPLPRDAVVAVHAYPPDGSGRFPDPWDVADAVPPPDGAPTSAADVMRVTDVSRAGHPLGRTRLSGLPASLSLGELLDRRVRDEVAVYDADPGPVYVGLVQPHDAVRYSDGSRMRAPRHLDVEAFVAAALEAVAAGLLRARIGGPTGDRVLTRLEDEVPVALTDELTFVLERPVVAAEPRSPAPAEGSA
jgi:uncharacterized protein (DUF952 family)